MPDGLIDAVEYANQKVYSGIEGTVGMLSTLSALIYDPDEEKAYVLNIGDSRVYGLIGNEWHQLSKDDVSNEPFLKNGK